MDKLLFNFNNKLLTLNVLDKIQLDSFAYSLGFIKVNECIKDLNQSIKLSATDGKKFHIINILNIKNKIKIKIEFKNNLYFFNTNRKNIKEIKKAML